MPKATGGSGGSSIFTTNITNDTVVGNVLYINIGLIPTGKYLWYGTGQYASPDKSVSFELRTNKTGLSTGTDLDTVAIAASASVTPKSGQKTVDYYQSGRLTTKSVVGTGVENMWLKLKSTSGSLGSVLYSINFTSN